MSGSTEERGPESRADDASEERRSRAADLRAAVGALVALYAGFRVWTFDGQGGVPRALVVLAFAGILSAHGGGAWLCVAHSRRRRLGEILLLSGTLLFGLSIRSISRAYPIPGDSPDVLLVWGLGALAMAWTVPSVAQGAMAAVLLAAWACVGGHEFGRPMHFSVPLA